MNTQYRVKLSNGENVWNVDFNQEDAAHKFADLQLLSVVGTELDGVLTADVYTIISEEYPAGDGSSFEEEKEFLTSSK